MANTKILMFYIFFIVIFGTLAGLIGLNNDDFDLNNFLVVSSLRSKLDANDGIFSSVLKVVLIPFLIIDFVVGLFGIIGPTCNT